MALVPLNVWKLDKDGRPLLDGKGNRIPHPKPGPKPRKEWTAEERLSHDQQHEHDQSARRRSAQLIVEPIRDAEKMLNR